MLTRDHVHHFAQEWITAWNSHDLDQIMTHYDENVQLTSPVAAQLLGLPDGTVKGKADLRKYFAKGLQAFPELHFTLKDVCFGIQSVVLYYVNQKGTHSGEFMELSPEGKVTKVVANYSMNV